MEKNMFFLLVVFIDFFPLVCLNLPNHFVAFQVHELSTDFDRQTRFRVKNGRSDGAKSEEI